MENYNSTLEDYKNKTIEYILGITFKLFCLKGIQKVTFNEIAKESNIGVATLYRYFKNKNKLVSECAIFNLNKIVNEITPLVNTIQFKEKVAIEEFEEFLNFFVIFFNKKTDFLKFLNEFDNYFSFNEMEKDFQNIYNQLYLTFYEIAKSIYQKGLIDKSFKEDIDFKTLYFTVASTLLQTSIKGAVNPSFIPIDELVSTKDKLKTQIKLAINYCTRS